MATRKKIELPKRVEIETFRAPDSYQLGNLTQSEPDCWNGVVSVRKWRIVMEEIQEPKAAIIARIAKIWRDEDNHHHMGPIMAVAKSYGVELNSADFGANKRKARA